MENIKLYLEKDYDNIYIVVISFNNHDYKIEHYHYNNIVKDLNKIDSYSTTSGIFNILHDYVNKGYKRKYFNNYKYLAL